MIRGAYRTSVSLDAERLLRDHDMTVERVVSVDRDSILYVNKLGRARTCWIHVPARGPMRLYMAAGFECEPPLDWHKERSGDRLRESKNYGLAG